MKVSLWCMRLGVMDRMHALWKIWYAYWALGALLPLSYQQTAPKAPAIPVSPSCAGNLKPTFVMYADTKAGAGASGQQSFTDQTLGSCSQLCANDKAPAGGGDILCGGFEYNPSTKTCTTYAAFDPTQYVSEAGTGFFQKTCVESAQVCQSPFQFEATPQRVLVGFAKVVVPASAPNDCLKACLDSYTTNGFECQSSMYYPVDQNCILNMENRYKRPDLFVEENKDQVLYFDNNCAGATCYSPFTTGYTKTADITLSGVTGVTLSARSLQACEWLCTHRIAASTGEQYNCKSFMYRASDQTCILNDDRLQPLGRYSSAPTPGTDYFEKGCYASKRTCRNPPSFTRHPNMILIGYAGYVVEKVPSVTQCLDSCLTLPKETGALAFKCMSVMYYYSEQECILNSDTKDTRPDVFVPEPSGKQVDYFDIMCLETPETCPNGTTPSSIRIPNAIISPNSNITLKEAQPGSPDDCRDACYKLSPEKCRSFNYNKNGDQCTLLLINSDSAFPAPVETSDVYDLLCMTGTLCNETAPFDRTPLKANPAKPSKSLDAPTALPDCLAECLNAGCLGVNYNVFSGKCDLYMPAARVRRQAPTATAGVTGGAGSQRINLEDNPSVDWYQSNCALGPAGVETICTFEGMKVIVTNSLPITGAVFAKMKYDTCRTEVKNSRMAMLSLGFPVDQIIAGCGDEGCGGGAPGYGGGGGKGYQAAPSGRYAPQPQGYDGGKGPGCTGDGCAAGHGCTGSGCGGGYGSGPPAVEGYGGCTGSGCGGGCAGPGCGGGRCNGPGCAAGGGGCAGGRCNGGPLVPPMLQEKDCGVIDLQNGTYKATIVVQSNNLGIPGLVTSNDLIYDVSCDYSALQAKKILANATLHVEGPTPALIQPRGRIMIGSPVSLQLMGGAGFAALQAKLGDVLQLHWELMTLDDDLDFFVQKCIAEPGAITVPVGKPGRGRGRGPYGGGGATCAGGECTLQGGIPRDFGDVSSINPAAPGCIGGQCILQGGAPAGIPQIGRNCVGGQCQFGGSEGASLEDQLQQHQLLLIDRGCPAPAVSGKIMQEAIVRLNNKTKTAKMQAFRFDESRSIRVICQLDICIGQCNPTTCTVGDQNATSWGRRKRQGVHKYRPQPIHGRGKEEDDEEHYVTTNYLIPKRASTMTSIVILDPADGNVNEAVVANKERATAQRLDGRRLHDENTRLSPARPGKVCMTRSMFFGAFSFLTCLAFAQAVAVGVIISRQCFPRKTK